MTEQIVHLTNRKLAGGYSRYSHHNKETEQIQLLQEEGYTTATYHLKYSTKDRARYASLLKATARPTTVRIVQVSNIKDIGITLCTRTLYSDGGKEPIKGI